MKKMRVMVSAVVVVVVVGVGCLDRKPPNLSPAGQRAYTALEIATQVSLVQNAAIEANLRPASGVLSDKHALLINGWCMTVAPILKAAPAGWGVIAGAGYTELRRKLVGVTLPPALVLVLDVLDIMLQPYVLGGAA